MLTVGLIGVGMIGRKYLDLLKEKSDVSVKALAVQSEASYAKLKDEFGTTYDLYTDYRQMLADNELQAILVLTPHPTHYAIARDVLKAHKHLFVEKPLVLHALEAEELVHQAEKSGKVFAVGYNQRFMPSYQKAKELLAENVLGTIQRSHWVVTTMYRTDSYYQQNAWRGTKDAEGGGVLLNQGNHQLDLYRWLLGQPSRVASLLRIGVRRQIEVEEAAEVLLDFSPQHFGSLVLSVTEPYPEDTLTITGTTGKMVVTPQEVTLTYNNQEASPQPAHKPQGIHQEVFHYHATKEASYPLMLANFVASCQGEETVLASGGDAAATVRLLEAIYDSAEFNTWISPAE
ncbi:Gfo/Idh/MocA family protein [Enterococcus nangangensis]|uniref:Gfo/Idh/MocA family protein n=1 Tax=Enterococcus nangangensis TaxID=2559926 RepID=UPI0010F59CE5|nr:Gfo/Idh/MocA family oxidoreductase [Enterococcus nangangensis]